MHRRYREKEAMPTNEVIMYNTLSDWLPLDSPALVISKFVDEFVNEKNPYYSKGNKKVGVLPYGIRQLLKLFIYGYLNRIQSSRRLSAECRRNIEVIYLMGNLRPSYHTIADFRKDNSDLISDMTESLVDYLREKGLIKGRSVSVDGTKIKALANKTIAQVLNKDIDKLKRSIADYLKGMDSNDADCDIKDEMIDRLQSRIAYLEEQLQRSNEDAPNLEIEGYDRYDKDCRSMRFKDRQYLPAYNTQVAVDNQSHMIIATKVTSQANDLNQLQPMVEECQASTGQAPVQAIADSGYYNYDDIEKVQSSGTECIVPPRKNNMRENDSVSGLEFKYDKERNLYICPLNKELQFKGIKNARGRDYQTYQAYASDCRKCRLYGICTKARTGRSYWRSVTSGNEDVFKKKMLSKASQKLIKARKGYIENVFGTLKIWMGKLPLLLRGKEKVQTEINLYTIAYNIKRFINITRESTLKTESELVKSLS